ncbi:MAG: DUF3073 domain-containing protein [Propionibacteriaceae bacterium]|jgi:hypothetical protein|nr:DUF3073 domain-containing protein [Propionibacteriaceae bacterium]
MGRGRAKAKQTRVARDLKYRSVSTDFASLEAELRGSSGLDDIPPAYADLAEAYLEEDVDESDDLSDEVEANDDGESRPVT